jgi:hypothetical protein
VGPAQHDDGGSPFHVRAERHAAARAFDDDELTDPGPLPPGSDGGLPTGRWATPGFSPDALAVLPDIDSHERFSAFDESLPDARAEVYRVSDLDGDVDGPGAPTAIMERPPAMVAVRAFDDPSTPEHTSEEEAASASVQFQRWSAGPSSRRPNDHTSPDAAPPPVVSPGAQAKDRPLPSDASSSASLTALSTSQLLDEAWRAVTAAQEGLAAGAGASTSQTRQHLSRAAAALSQLRSSSR